jgi:hypothetical protein
VYRPGGSFAAAAARFPPAFSVIFRLFGSDLLRISRHFFYTTTENSSTPGDRQKICVPADGVYRQMDEHFNKIQEKLKAEIAYSQKQIDRREAGYSNTSLLAVLSAIIVVCTILGLLLQITVQE